MLWTRIVRPFAVAGLALATLASPVRAQFEGAVTVRMTTPSDHRSIDATYLIRQGLTRVEMTIPGGPTVAVIMDPTARTMTTIMDQQKIYMVRDYGEMIDTSSSDKFDAKVTRTGKTEMVAGKSCEHITVTDKDGTVTDICGATGMGRFMGIGSPGFGGTRGMEEQPAWAKDLVRQGFFPLKVDGKDMHWEVTRIEQKSLDASLFVPPAGYRKMDMGAMMRPPRP